MVWTTFQPISSLPADSCLSGEPSPLRRGCCCPETRANCLSRPWTSVGVCSQERLPVRSLTGGLKAQMKAGVTCLKEEDQRLAHPPSSSQPFCRQAQRRRIKLGTRHQKAWVWCRQCHLQPSHFHLLFIPRFFLNPPKEPPPSHAYLAISDLSP